MLSLLLLGVGYATLPASADLAQSPFLFLKDLRVGMEGIGKTTIRGDQVRSFQTRIIGVIDNPGELSDYILVRSSGDLIREAGGYAAGMSGSPIYINDRLVGAFFAAFLYDESPNPIGLVRPIETMLRLIESIQGPPQAEDQSLNPSPDELRRLIQKVRLEDGKPKEVVFVSRPPSLEERRANPDTVYAVLSGTPLWVSGLSGRALEWLREGVDPRILEEHTAGFLDPAKAEAFLAELARGFEERYGPIYPFAAAAQAGDFPEGFEEGRPMAALLANGDVTLGGVCTTSYIDPQTDVLLACGHQLFLTGESNLFLAQARVLDTVNSAPFSFVLPEVDRYNVLGTVLQDRFQAIGAALDLRPRAIRLTAHLEDLTTGTNREFEVNIAEVGNFVPVLVFLTLLQAVDTTMNRIGPGTMKIEYTIRGSEMPRKLVRSDVFTSFSDIALLGPLQVAQVVLTLHQNEFQDPKLYRIDVDIETTRPIRLLQVRSLKTDKEVYQPGETIRYVVELVPYRGELIEASGSFQLPEDLKARRLTLHVFGGPRQKKDQGQTLEYEDLEGLIEALEGLTTNDQLTVELLGLPSEEGEESSFKDVQRLGDWVVTGEERVTVQIELPKPEEPKEPGQEPKEPEQKPEEPEEPECDQPFYC